MRRSGIVLALALKGVLLVLLLVLLGRPELADLSDRALAGRVVLALVALVAVPAWWWLASRRRPVRYPWEIDAVLAIPFLVELAGRLAGLHESISFWEVVTHLVNWTLLVLVFGLLLGRRVEVRLILAALCIGFGATMTIVWELAEHVAGVHRIHETMYEETLSDLAFALVGSAVGAALVVLAAARTQPSPGPGHPALARALMRSDG
jgi:hypothetical protein